MLQNKGSKMMVSQKTGWLYRGPTMPAYSGVNATLAPTMANNGKKPIQKSIDPGTEI